MNDGLKILENKNYASFMEDFCVNACGIVVLRGREMGNGKWEMENGKFLRDLRVTSVFSVTPYGLPH